MKPLLIAADVDGGVEELGKTGCGEELLAGTVTYDAAGAHKNDALDLRQDVAEVMRDEHEAGRGRWRARREATGGGDGRERGR